MSINGKKIFFHDFFRFTRLILYILFVYSPTSTFASFQERIRTEPKQIFIKYEEEIKGEYIGFHQTVNISIFDIKPEDCSNSNQFCLKWGDQAQFTIMKNDQCENFEFSSTLDKPLTVSFDISNVHIYGGAEQDFQKWPMDFDDYQKHPFVTSVEYTSSVLEPYWLVSTGLYLYVNRKVPLFITQNKKKGIFQLIAERQAPYIRDGPNTLQYTVCKFANMKEAHLHAINHVLGKPTGIPDKKMVQYPVWSTWAKYKADINEKVVLEFADLITKHNLPNSQLEIDDRWETCYGSLEIDTTRFPNMKSLVDKLKSKGYRVTAWVHPFVDVKCEPYYSYGLKMEYFIKSTSGSTVVDWWNGFAGVIDFTNPKAVEWFENRLKKIQQESGIQSFKFDAGESRYAPQVPIFYKKSEDHPETGLKEYVRVVSGFGDMVEVRSARETQKYPIFVRMLDRDTNWDGHLALSTLIPALLQMNIVGYPFVLPDMIGGNGYDKAVMTKELFIRWLQINVFMPALQFSYPPWDFDEELMTITRKYIDLHAKYSDNIIQAMNKAVKTGVPVNPPIWWLDPSDPIAQNIDSEFLLGENILVAPVTKQGAKSRDIYLPKGIWRDELHPEKPPKKGPLWLYNYPADLDTLPYFTKVGDVDHDKNNARTFSISFLLTSLSLILVIFRNFLVHI